MFGGGARIRTAGRPNDPVSILRRFAGVDPELANCLSEINAASI